MISNNKILLRDFIEDDIETRIYWETKEIEWQLWDAPWDYELKSEEELNSDLKEYVENMKNWAKKFKEMPIDAKRTSFQIVVKDLNEYIGWCNSYRINNGNLCAIGIDIPNRASRGKGYATSAIILFIKYLMEHGETDLYTQTWSGNIRMINLAKKIGFEECKREKNIRLVRGQQYDGLTFKLNIEKFNNL